MVPLLWRNAMPYSGSGWIPGPLQPVGMAGASANYQLYNHVWCAGWATPVQAHHPLSPALLQPTSEVSASVLVLLSLHTTCPFLFPSHLLKLGSLIPSSPALNMEAIVIFFFYLLKYSCYTILYKLQMYNMVIHTF